jgi:hypothetical protein
MGFIMLPDFVTNVSIEKTAVPFCLEGTTSRGVLWQAAYGRFLLDVPDMSRYLVEDGRRIAIDSSPSASEVDVQRFLRMTPLAALFFQQGVLAIHAAAVVNDNGAVIIAGDSGSGKSTLAAVMLKRGWRILSDDITAIDLNDKGMPIVLPLFPEIILWSDAMERLGIEHNGKGRNVLSVEDRFVASTQPLKAIFRMTVHKNELECSAAEGTKVFSTLTSTSYNSRVADALFDRAIFMRLATAIAGTVPVYNIKRPRGRWCMDELADLVERECP